MALTFIRELEPVQATTDAPPFTAGLDEPPPLLPIDSILLQFPQYRIKGEPDVING